MNGPKPLPFRVRLMLGLGAVAVATVIAMISAVQAAPFSWRTVAACVVIVGVAIATMAVAIPVGEFVHSRIVGIRRR